MSTTEAKRTSASGLPMTVLTLREELITGQHQPCQTWQIAGCDVQLSQGSDSLWLTVRRADGTGFALRTAYSPGAPLAVQTVAGSGGSEFEAAGAVGNFRVSIDMPDPERSLVRATVRLTPSRDLIIPYWPRDLYPLSRQGDPTGTGGVVRAAQRGLNTGLIYLTINEPAFGSVLYLQDLTSLNAYFNATGTKPDGRIGGQWPELGYAPPVSETQPLKAGEEVVLSDVFVHWGADLPETPQQSSRIFLDHLAAIYRHMKRPEGPYHDWPARAEETLRDLRDAPEATIRHYGHTYQHPYTGAEYPDSMVQLTVLTPLREYARWKGEKIPFVDELRSGFKKFFDPELGVVRRYLPNVGSDKNAEEVDSWYLYHPLLNLARLSEEGDEEAREILLTSLEYGIKVAHHFRYEWPVQYNVRTLEVIKGARKGGQPGQSDVGGLYAYLMLQVWELTENKRYLEEAKKAIHNLSSMEFELEYQSNLTGWGANACLRLWQLTRDGSYRDQSYVFLANFFHNTMIWESEIELARHYPIFLGASCLHDGPYMAIYECFESFASFQEYLDWGNDMLPESVILLVTEYCKHALNRAWFYYPKELPEEALAKEVRNGHIDRSLAFPLEDIYPDGQPAGQVGQEIYGSGAAFTFVSHSYHKLQRAPFILFSEYPIIGLEQTSDPCIAFRSRGADGFHARGRLIPTGEAALPDIHIRETGWPEKSIEGRVSEEGHLEFDIPAGRALEIRWKE